MNDLMYVHIPLPNNYSMLAQRNWSLFRTCNFPSYFIRRFECYSHSTSFKFKRRHCHLFHSLTHSQAVSINHNTIALFIQGSLQSQKQQTTPVNLFIIHSEFSATSKRPLPPHHPPEMYPVFFGNQSGKGQIIIVVGTGANFFHHGN